VDGNACGGAKSEGTEHDMDQQDLSSRLQIPKEMLTVEKFKEWLPIDGKQFDSPQGIYTARAIDWPDPPTDQGPPELLYTFEFTSPGRRDRFLRLWVLPQDISQPQVREKIISIISAWLQRDETEAVLELSGRYNGEKGLVSI